MTAAIPRSFADDLSRRVALALDAEIQRLVAAGYKRDKLRIENDGAYEWRICMGGTRLVTAYVPLHSAAGTETVSDVEVSIVRSDAAMAPPRTPAIPRPVPNAGIVRWERFEDHWRGFDAQDCYHFYVSHGAIERALTSDSKAKIDQIIRLAFGPCEHGGQWTLLEDREREVLGREPGGRHLHPCDECTGRDEERMLESTIEAIARAAEPQVVADAVRMIKEQRTYQIPAREVVPGMLWQTGFAGPFRAVSRVRRYQADVARVGIEADGGAAGGIPATEILTIALPGPSPRELCCTCGSWYPYAKPSDAPSAHLDGRYATGIVCPVAPRPGVHGGMRLWPVGGIDFSAAYGYRLSAPVNFRVFPEDIAAFTKGFLDGAKADVIAEKFLLPLVAAPEPDRRPPVDVDPELAAAEPRMRRLR